MIGARLSNLFVLCLAAVQLPPTAAAQELSVATKHSPPFAYRDVDGAWTGISVDLFEELARRTSVAFTWVEARTAEELVDGVADGRFDLAIAAISVSAERERKVDFTHPYFSTGLGVAVRGDADSGVARIFRGVLSRPFLTLVGSVLVALIVSGVLFWLVEKRRNPQFEGPRREGIGQGLWWSTIMLFGHKGIFPRSATGRVLAATSMLISILLLSVLTGAVASALTVGHFEALIRDHNDLRHVRTLAVDGTSAADFLRRQLVAYESTPDVTTGLHALAGGGADALVHDAPLLEHEILRHPEDGLQVLPRTFELQDYAIALPQGSGLREPLNDALLTLRTDRLWQDIRFRYLGR